MTTYDLKQAARDENEGPVQGGGMDGLGLVFWSPAGCQGYMAATAGKG